jgi:hypothetical protein
MSETIAMPARIYFEGPFQGIGCKSAEIRDGDRNLIAEVHGATDTEAIERAAVLVARYNLQAELVNALKYPRHGDTAKLLEKAADMIDTQTEEGWSSYFTPHLRRAAKMVRKALERAAHHG